MAVGEKDRRIQGPYGFVTYSRNFLNLGFVQIIHFLMISLTLRNSWRDSQTIYGQKLHALQYKHMKEFYYTLLIRNRITLTRNFWNSWEEFKLHIESSHLIFVQHGAKNFPDLLSQHPDSFSIRTRNHSRSLFIDELQKSQHNISDVFLHCWHVSKTFIKKAEHTWYILI